MFDDDDDTFEGKPAAQRERQNYDDPLQNTQLIQRVAAPSEYAQLVEIMGREPRERDVMIREAREIGSLLGVYGFYRWTQGGKRIQGASVDLAYALAQAWGRCVTRCRVEENAGNRVVLRGIFVDLLTMAICERDYIAAIAPAPGRYAKDPIQSDRWRVMQEQAAISKAVRGAILGGLPTWYTEAGLAAAVKAADDEVLCGKDGKPRPLADVRESAIAKFAKNGISQAELEAYLDQAAELWTVLELGRLGEVISALRAGTLTEAAFKAECVDLLPKAAKGEGSDAPKRRGKADKGAKDEKSAGTGAGADASAGKGATDGAASKSEGDKPARTAVELIAGIKEFEESCGEAVWRPLREEYQIALTTGAEKLVKESPVKAGIYLDRLIYAAPK